MIPALPTNAAQDRSALVRAGLGWLAILGPLFFVSYGLTNQWAARRTDVPSVVFDWEHGIPFVPWSIVPYWSIDVMYVLSLFVCQSKSELHRHAARLITAQLIAVLCFTLFPLRFTFERPPTDGVPGWLFHALASFDLPYNQAPSLHVALLVILWAHRHPHTPAHLRGLLNAWCVLIGVSVLTTYQHHFIDVPTGLWLGWFALWLIPATGPACVLGRRLTADTRRRELALRYLLGALALSLIPLNVGGAALWLLWAAGAALLVGLTYLLGEASALGKTPEGKLRTASWWLLWPYVLAIWINARIRTRNRREPVPVTHDVWLAPLPDQTERNSSPSRAIIDLTPDLPLRQPVHGYRNIPMMDLIAPTAKELTHAINGISAMRVHGPVVVCCALGLSRSATVAAAWLMHHQGASAEEALHRILSLRPHAVFTDAHVDSLRAFARQQAIPSS